MSEFMIYGANGYTGKLIAHEAKRRGLSPILAGRNKESLLALGNLLNLRTKVFSCDSVDQISKNLQGMDLLLHCAGPFSSTSAPMLEGCLATKTHYLDITGEISVFGAIHSQGKKIREAGIVAMPGVGFDVVPTDCLALQLKELLPDAHRLALGFIASKLSPGTAATMIEGLSQGGAIRENGKIVQVPAAFRRRKIVFNKTPRMAMTIGWGDVTTAYYSTKIPNIEVYLAAPPWLIGLTKLSRPLQKFFGKVHIQSFLKKYAKSIEGPTEEERKTHSSLVWGEVSNERGEKKELRLKVPEAYALTVDTALACVEKVLQGSLTAGAWTPSQAFGSKFILDMPGVEFLSSH